MQTIVTLNGQERYNRDAVTLCNELWKTFTIGSRSHFKNEKNPVDLNSDRKLSRFVFEKIEYVTLIAYMGNVT